MKNSQHNISIVQNTNVAICESEADCKHIREGSFIVFGNESNFHTVSKTESFFYIKDAQILEQDKLLIDGDVGIYLLNGDCLDISYKEYELATVFSVTEAGSGFRIGDILSPESGIVSVDNFTGQKKQAKLSVLDTDANGGIIKVSLVDRGSYIVAPDSLCSVKNAKLNLQWRVMDEREMVERTVEKVNFQNNQTHVHLSGGLPNGVSEIKLSVQKWKIFLNDAYSGETRQNVTIRVLRDVTPNLGLPLAQPNCPNFEAIYNKAMTVLDKRVKAIEERFGG